MRPGRENVGHINNLIEHYGYFGIVIALIGGIIGLPIPDEVLLTYVGYNVFLDKMAYLTSVLSAFIGALGGISLSYLLGIKLGLPFLQKFGPKFHISQVRINKTKALFLKFGPTLLFIGYFIPGIRHVTAYLAGINSFSFKKFALYAYSGAFLWCFTFITIGKMLGERWRILAFYLIKNKMVIIPLATLLLVFALVYWKKRKRAIEAKGAFE
jgi:membrane protein DedA with SNARE-associated domain